MTTEATTRPRISTRDDGRERVAVPLRSGILASLGALAIIVLVSFVFVFIITVVAVIETGKAPVQNPASPTLVTVELLAYLAAGWFAWRALRRTGVRPFRRLTGSDWRTIGVGLCAILAVRIVTAVVLSATHQSNHVQTGFDHFKVSAAGSPEAVLPIVLIVLTIVAAGPLVEEMIFRGLLFGALAPRIGVAVGALVAALFFAATHFDLVLFPTLAALGFISALAYARTANLWTSVILHACNNGVATAALIALGSGR